MSLITIDYGSISGGELQIEDITSKWVAPSTSSAYTADKDGILYVESEISSSSAYTCIITDSKGNTLTPSYNAYKERRVAFPCEKGVTYYCQRGGTVYSLWKVTRYSV